MRSSQRATRALDLDKANEQAKVDPTAFSPAIRGTLARMRLHVAMEEQGACAEMWFAVIGSAITDLTKPHGSNYHSALNFFNRSIIPQAEAIGINSNYLKQTLITLRLI